MFFIYIYIYISNGASRLFPPPGLFSGPSPYHCFMFVVSCVCLFFIYFLQPFDNFGLCCLPFGSLSDPLTTFWFPFGSF